MPCQLPGGHGLRTVRSPGGQRSHTGAEGLVDHQVTCHQPAHMPCGPGRGRGENRDSPAQRRGATGLWGGRGGGSPWGGWGPLSRSLAVSRKSRVMLVILPDLRPAQSGRGRRCGQELGWPGRGLVGTGAGARWPAATGTQSPGSYAGPSGPRSRLSLVGPPGSVPSQRTVGQEGQR